MVQDINNTSDPLCCLDVRFLIYAHRCFPQVAISGVWHILGRHSRGAGYTDSWRNTMFICVYIYILRLPVVSEKIRFELCAKKCSHAREKHWMKQSHFSYVKVIFLLVHCNCINLLVFFAIAWTKDYFYAMFGFYFHKWWFSCLRYALMKIMHKKFTFHNWVLPH